MEIGFFLTSLPNMNSIWLLFIWYDTAYCVENSIWLIAHRTDYNSLQNRIIYKTLLFKSNIWFYYIQLKFPINIYYLLLISSNELIDLKVDYNHILNLMKVVSLHQVYFCFKQFKTIGFHVQGNYDITAQVIANRQTSTVKGFPICKNVKYTQNKTNFQEEEELDKEGYCNQESCKYHTPKYFEIKFSFTANFNDQVIMFDGHCIFKFQIEAEKEDEYQLYLLLELNYKKQKIKRKQQSAENFDSNRSQAKINQFQNKQVKDTIVSSAKILINLNTDDVLNNPQLSYLQIPFTTYQYFSSLIFIANHIKLGYLIRPYAYQLNTFRNNKKQNKNKGNSITQKQLYQLLISTFQSSILMYRKLVLNSIAQFHQLQNLQQYLFNKDESNFKVYLRKKYRKDKEKDNLKTFVSLKISEHQFENTKQNLLNFYQCERGEKQLSAILYNKAIHGKWQNCLQYYDKKVSFSNSVFNQRNQIISQHLSNQVYANTLQQSWQYQQCIPKIKYYQTNYLKIPYFYRFPSQNPIKQQNNKAISFDSALKGSLQKQIFILVHGFNGNQFDMNKIKSFLNYLSPYHFIVLRNISTKITQSLEQLGKIAAEEITNALANKMIKKINFIGFSLGSVIIRACLAHLPHLYDKFNVFISLSSPHLGINENDNCLVRTGISFLQKIKGVKNLRQICQSLHYNKKQTRQEIYQEQNLTYFQLLACDNSISNFNMVILFGGYDDQYVPGYSSLLEYEGTNPRIIKMQKQLNKRIKNIEKVSVNFHPETRGTFWQRISGRRIHINYLDNQPFLFFLISAYCKYF